MQSSDIKAIIFDVDGVLFKTYDQNKNFLWSSTIKQDLGLTSEHLSVIFSHKWYDIIRGKIDLSEHLNSVFQEKLFQDLAITPKKYIEYWLSKDNHINQYVLKLAKQLKAPCYLGTNQEGTRTSHILSTIGSYFKGCFASYEIGFIKPEREFFQHIQNTLGLLPHELLLIDDTEHNIEEARRCGWYVYHYQNNIEDLERFLVEFIN